MKKVLSFILLFGLSVSCFARVAKVITVKNETSVSGGWKFKISDGKKYLTSWNSLPKKGSAKTVTVDTAAETIQIRTVSRFKSSALTSGRIGIRVDLVKNVADEVTVILKEKKNLSGVKNFVEIEKNIEWEVVGINSSGEKVEESPDIP